MDLSPAAFVEPERLIGNDPALAEQAFHGGGKRLSSDPSRLRHGGKDLWRIVATGGMADVSALGIGGL